MRLPHSLHCTVNGRGYALTGQHPNNKEEGTRAEALCLRRTDGDSAKKTGVLGKVYLSSSGHTTGLDDRTYGAKHTPR